MVNVLIMHKKYDLIRLADPLDHQCDFKRQRYEILVIALIQQSFEILSLVIKLLLYVEFHFVGDQA